MRTRRHAAASLWLASAKAGLDTWATLSRRVPMLMSGTATEREKRRMVTEKVAAGVASAQAASRKAQTVLLRRPTTDPSTALGRTAEIAQAAARPFQARVARNAKRLKKT